MMGPRGALTAEDLSRHNRRPSGRCDSGSKPSLPSLGPVVASAAKPGRWRAPHLTSGQWTRHGKARRGNARCGMAGRGRARNTEFPEPHIRAGTKARHGKARFGMARRGKAGQGAPFPRRARHQERPQAKGARIPRPSLRPLQRAPGTALRPTPLSRHSLEGDGRSLLDQSGVRAGMPGLKRCSLSNPR